MQISAETHFNLSLNGSELLTDSGQTLSACGIVSGDLVCVVLPETHSGSNTQTQSHTLTQSTAQSDDQRNKLSDSHSNALSQVSEFSAAGSPPGNSSGFSGPRSSSWEPMLCSEAEEGQVPLSLELLYHSAQTRTRNDALMVAVHLLMMETGFVSEVCLHNWGHSQLSHAGIQLTLCVFAFAGLPAEAPTDASRLEFPSGSIQAAIHSPSVWWQCGAACGCQHGPCPRCAA